MKKILFCAVLILSSVSMVYGAGDGTTLALEGAGWYWGIGPEIDVPVQNFSPAFNLGLGGQLTAGYDFDKGLAVQLSVENAVFSASGNSVYDLRLIPQLKGSADLGGWQAYLLAGPGLDLEFAPGLSTSSFDLSLGPGVQLPLGGQIDLFVTWNFNFIFGNGVTGMDMPVVAGLLAPL